MLAGWDAIAFLLVIILVEFAILQAFAVGVTVGIYRLVPLMDVGSPQGFDDWLDVFTVVSPTLTLPGGAAIVLSTWILARKARQAELRADAAEATAEARLAEKVQAAVAVAVAEAVATTRAESASELADLRAELEQLTRRRRQRIGRRRLA